MTAFGKETARRLGLLAAGLLLATPLYALEPALLVIGSSFGKGDLHFNDDLQAPYGGISTMAGSYLSLGDALVRERTLPGFVINEAQGGATTFDRETCHPVCTPGVGWQGFEKQLAKALARVSYTDPASGARRVNARYVVITMANDCLHSDAFGIPEDEAKPCSVEEMDAYIDRLIDIGQKAIDADLVPVFGVMPAWERLDLNILRQMAGFRWMIDEADYKLLRERLRSRLLAELPGALVLNYWRGYRHLGDGLHPNPATAQRAARRIARAISAHQAQIRRSR